MCTQKRTFDHLINQYGMQPRCWVSYTPLFLRVLLGLVRNISMRSSTPCSRLPVRLRRFVWISPGLWFYDRSEIVSKSSRFRCLSPRRLVASNLGRYKTIYPMFAAKLFLFLNLLSWRSGHPCASLYRHLSFLLVCRVVLRVLPVALRMWGAHAPKSWSYMVREVLALYME